MKKHKQTILPLLLLVALLLVGLCDRAYAEEPARYPYLTSFDVSKIKYRNGKFDTGKDGQPKKTEWYNYEDGPHVPDVSDSGVNYVLGEITVYTNGLTTNGKDAKVIPIYTLANSDLVSSFDPASGKTASGITPGKKQCNIICFTVGSGADSIIYGYNLTVEDGSNLQEEKPTEIKLESIAVTRTADDTATANL